LFDYENSKNFESAHHFQIQSERPIRIESRTFTGPYHNCGTFITQSKQVLLICTCPKLVMYWDADSFRVWRAESAKALCRIYQFLAANVWAN